MTSKITTLCIIASSLVCRCAFASSGGDSNAYIGAEKSIVFNGWYQSGKEKWQGPFHNKLLFTWMIPMTTAGNELTLARLIRDQRQNDVKFIGCYYSSTMAVTPKPAGHYLKYPEIGMPPRDAKREWFLRSSTGRFITSDYNENNYFLDVGKKEVQDAILSRAIGNAKRFDMNLLYLDNWYYKFWAPRNMKAQQWTEKCFSLLKRARELTNSADMKLVVNTSSPPENWPEFAPYLDGIAYEMGAHPGRLKERRKYEAELSSYEKVMAMGKTVFLYTNILTHNGGRWDRDGRKAAATAMLVMPKNQPYWGGIYLRPPVYEVWPVGGWPMWPEQLGEPLGPRKWQGNTVTRNFEHGSISVTTGDPPKFNISINY